MNEYSGRIIDGHIHPFANGETCFAYFGSPSAEEEFFSEMKRFGIDRCCGSVICKNKPETWQDIEKLNREVLDIAGRHPGILIPGFQIHPGFAAQSEKFLASLKNEKNVWIGELVAYMMDYSYLSPEMFQLFDCISAYGYPVNIHISTGEARVIAKNFPGLKMVVAHPGSSQQEVNDRVQLLKDFPNVSLDLSGTGLLRWNVTRYLIDQTGAGRIIFGSDFPLCNAGAAIDAVKREHLDSAEMQAVFCDNFLQLMER